jgi:PAS domain-containing protein
MPVTEHGGPFADGPYADGSCDGAERSGPHPLDPVARVDLQRAQQARYGTEPHPDAALFASRLARVVAEQPPVSAAMPDSPRPLGPVPSRPAPLTVVPLAPAAPAAGEGKESTVKLAPAGAPRLRPRPSPRPRVLGAVAAPGESPLGVVEGPASATTKAPAAVPAGSATDLLDAEAVVGTVAPGRVDLPLPAAAAALVRDRADRIVQVNAALERLTGRTEAELLGAGVSAFVAGAGAEAHLMGAAAPLPVHLLQWDVPDRDLQVVVLVPRPDHGAERRWTAELERMARVGTWRYELATGTLHRSEPLQ